MQGSWLSSLDSQALLIHYPCVVWMLDKDPLALKDGFLKVEFMTPEIHGSLDFCIFTYKGELTVFDAFLVMMLLHRQSVL